MTKEQPQDTGPAIPKGPVHDKPACFRGGSLSHRQALEMQRTGKLLQFRPHQRESREESWARMHPDETYVAYQPESLVSEVVQAGVGRMLARMDSLAASLKETTAAVEALQERLFEVEQRLASQPVVCQVTIHDLDSDQYTLRQPVCINIEQYEEETIARFPEIEAYASADTEAEAIALLKDEIVSLYEDLLQSNYQELGRRPRAWLKLLNDLIKSNGRRRQV